MRWYALRSKPNKEEALWREMGGRGQEVFFPFVRVQPVNPRARKMKPYFPGYLFVHINHLLVGPTLYAWMPYAQGLVSFGGQPAEVPDGLVSAIQSRVQEINASGGEALETQRRHASRFKEGDRVVINDGPFAGAQAIFDAHLTGVDRVRVLLLLIQARPIKLDLPAAQIQLTNRH
jgi:transcription antitermination factor NusG